MDSDDLEEFNRIISELARQTSVALDDLIPVAEKMIQNIGHAIGIVCESYAKYGYGLMPNNWLKMHGYPMRRRYR